MWLTATLIVMLKHHILWLDWSASDHLSVLQQ